MSIRERAFRLTCGGPVAQPWYFAVRMLQISGSD